MKTGRPRKPTALLEVTGAFEQNPQRKRTLEPKTDGLAVKPPFVKGRAARIWKQYAPLVTGMGLLKSVDAHSFGVWCCLAAEFEEDPRRMTAARIAAMRQAGEKFGLDPSARARLKTEDEEKKSDPAERYFVSSGPGNTLRQ